jgi:hypothetical protein
MHQHEWMTSDDPREMLNWHLVCENEFILWHCRSAACVHARGSWLVERLHRS